MRDRRSRLALALAAVGLVAIAAVFAASGSINNKSTAKVAVRSSDGDMPAALASHLAKLDQSIPGNGGEPSGESSNGPSSSSAGLTQFAQMAYPQKDVPLSSIRAARAAFRTASSRASSNPGHGGSADWEQVGPDTGLYQYTPFRDIRSYVPREYAASGRITDMAIDPNCGSHHSHGRSSRCRMWVTPAGGGVWRTENALAPHPNWHYLTGSFGINSVGSITIDPNDPSGNTLWVGTGEGNTCSSGCSAGVGLYKSTDGGDHWSGPYGTSAFNARGVGAIKVKPGDPNTIYAASAFAVRGMTSVCCYGGVTQYRALIPGAPQWGLYRSTDGGQSWTLVHNGSASPSDCGNDIAAIANNLTPCSPRGVRDIEIDPSDPNTVYASSYGRGVWRSNDNGTTWTQIKPSLNSTIGTTLPEMAVTTLPNGHTRMYVSEGHTSAVEYSRLYRSDEVEDGNPTFTQITSDDPSTSAWDSFNFCTGQCWYDNFVYTPPGHPDMVYLGGSYQYDEGGALPFVANHRAVLLSTNAGDSFTDMTMDSTDATHPNGLHPDQHVLVTNPANPAQFFEGNDGGVVRSSGQLVDKSSDCDSRGLAEPYLSRCHELLSAIPTRLDSLNRNLGTLQFWSLSVSPFNSKELQGGTQDNGTWENYGNKHTWLQTFWGDGGQSGFDATNPHFRFHTFYDASPDVNFSDGALTDWNWIADPIYGQAGNQFYIPIISDPVVHRTMYAGAATSTSGGQTVVRTKTNGQGTMTVAELRQHCNELTGDFAVPCGDWTELGTMALNAAGWGDRAGGSMAEVYRATTDTSTLWAATTTGRVFITSNADADPASSVAFVRLDSLASNSPNRWVTGIYIDPDNANHAWISYGGFNAATPSTPGHIFSVTYDPGAGTATWTSLDGSLGDLPLTDVAVDGSTVYVSSDFGVLKSDGGAWTDAGSGMPKVEVPGLTLVPGQGHGHHADSILYAASHGLGAWKLDLKHHGGGH